MSVKRLGFICLSQSWGGLEMHVHKLSLWMQPLGFQIFIYGYPDSPLHKHCQRDNLNFHPIKSQSKFNDIFKAKSLAETIKNDGVKNVILHTNKNFLLAVLAKKFSGNYFKLIYQQHMHIGLDKKDFFHSWLYNHLDLWLASLPSMAEAVKSKTNLDPNKIKIIPLGIELGHLTSNLPDKSEARKKLSLDENITIVGVIGRLDKKKCQHILIEAIARLHQDGHKLHALIVGNSSHGASTEYEQSLHQLTEQLQLQEYIHFLNHQNDPQYAFAALDIFAMTTESETYGIVTIEAMAAKLPVIGTDRGGTADIINHESNGLLVVPENSDKLAEAIIRLINNPSLSEKIARQARLDALENYSHRKQTEQLTAIIENLP